MNQIIEYHFKVLYDKISKFRTDPPFLGALTLMSYNYFALLLFLGSLINVKDIVYYIVIAGGIVSIYSILYVLTSRERLIHEIEENPIKIKMIYYGMVELIEARVKKGGGYVGEYAGEAATFFEDGNVVYVLRENGEFWTILRNKNTM